MTTTALSLIESFGDAHLRYATQNGVFIDVIREGQTQWVAYELQQNSQVGHEIEEASSEAELFQLLERKFR